MDAGLKAVVKAARSKSRLARLLHLTRGAICQWEEVPSDRVIAVEAATGVPRSVIRPDLHPPEKPTVKAALKPPSSLSPSGLKQWISKVCDLIGITPTELAQEAGLASSTINRFLRGNNDETLNGRTIEAITEAASRLRDRYGTVDVTREPIVNRVAEQRGVAQDSPLRLADAVKIAFPAGGMTVAGLRKEIGRGRLRAELIANKQFTTLADISEMRRLCRVPATGEKQYAVPTAGISPKDALLATLATAKSAKKSPKKSLRCLEDVRIHAGLSMDQLAKAINLKGQSSIQRYLEPDYNLGFRPAMMAKLKKALIGKGTPSITERDLDLLQQT